MSSTTKCHRLPPAVTLLAGRRELRASGQSRDWVEESAGRRALRRPRGLTARRAHHLVTASCPQAPSRPADAAVDAAPPEATVCVFHTAFLAHISQVERDRFNRQVLALSRRRTIYWIQAEPRRDPTEPRLRLTVCDGGRIAHEWPLGHYQPHGAWLEWLTVDVPAGPDSSGGPQPAGWPFSSNTAVPAATASRQLVRSAVSVSMSSSGTVPTGP